MNKTSMDSKEDLEMCKPIRSIKSRLLIFALCISLIPISIISTVYYVNARNTLKKQTFQWLTAVAESRELHVVEFMEGKRERTIDFGSDGFIRDSLETITREGYQSHAVISLNRYLKVNKKPLDHHIKAIAILDIKGKVVSSTHEPWIGEDMYREEVFSQAIGKSFCDTHVEQPQYIHWLNSNCILISAPLTNRKKNETIGVIINCYELEVLNEITANRSGMGETGEVYLVNIDKLMLTESRFVDNAPLRQMVDTELVNKIVEYGEESSGVYLDYRGEPVVGASMYMPEYDWILLAEMDKAEAFAHLKGFGIFALIAGLVCAVVVAVIGIVFANSTSSPIRKLTLATKILADGDLNYRVESACKDEIGVLAGSFNIMAGKLKSLNENLEQRVVERTEEVKGKNVQLTKEIAERKKAEEQIKASLKEKEVLLKEIHHRVKNNMQIMASLMRLQSEEIEDKHLLGLFNESRNRIQSMALIHDDLYQGKDLGSIDFDQYTRKLTGRLVKSFGVDPNRIIVSVNIDNVFLGVDTAIPCGLIINELFTNSLKYAFPLDKFGVSLKDKKGQIRIDCHSNSPEHTLVFSDNGVGLPEDIDIREAETMGLELVTTLVGQLGGNIELNRNNGTEFTITFRV